MVALTLFVLTLDFQRVLLFMVVLVNLCYCLFEVRESDDNYCDVV